MICAVLATLTMSLWCAETTDTTVFSDDFKDRAVFEKNWDFRSPTQPQEGVLFLAKNHYAPVLKTSIAGKDRITVETEIAVMDKKGFGGLNIDGILFFRGTGMRLRFSSPL